MASLWLFRFRFAFFFFFKFSIGLGFAIRVSVFGIFLESRVLAVNSCLVAEEIVGS